MTSSTEVAHPRRQSRRSREPADQDPYQVQDRLQHKIDLLRDTVDQWNPHHPTQAVRIAEWTTVLDGRQELLDQLRQRPDSDIEQVLSAQLDQADGFLNGPMHLAQSMARARAGELHISPKHDQPEAESPQPG